MKRLLLLTLILLTTTVVANPSNKAKATLLSSHSVITPGETLYMALSLVPDKGWHTYWKNPGDSGAPPSVDWDLPKGVTITHTYWQHPEKINYDTLVNFGFHDESLLVFEFQVSEKISQDKVSVRAKAEWLVCQDVCIPEFAEFQQFIRLGKASSLTPEAEKIMAVLESQPEDFPYPFAITPLEDHIVFELVYPQSEDIVSAYFFPDISVFAALSEAQVLLPDSGSVRLEVPLYDAGSGYVEGVLELELKGGKKEIYYLSNSTDALPENSSVGLLSAILFAIVGGLILNLMPCVFPILSLKVLSVASNATLSRKEVAQHALLYGAGVTVGLWSLFAVISILKSSGEALGWGFHLQSPYFVGGLIVLMSYIGFYLLDIVPLPRLLYSATSSAGRAQGSSAFLTGVLAVVVATPCTAPFMAVAIGAAFSLPVLYGFFVFTALAFGFALPFLVLAIKPSLAQKLPRPGAWLETLKEAMAFPMLLTVLWLLWVLYQQAGFDSVLLALALILLVGFSGWLSSKLTRTTMLWWMTLLLCAATLSMFNPTVDESESVKGDTVSDIHAAISEGKSVFVDVTASWCITCQLNKKAVLDRPEIQAFFNENNIEFIVLDWTNKDDEITEYLDSFGRNGVPLYVAYPYGKEVQILPQILSESSIKNVFK